MNRIEAIKTVVLILLIALSLTLTFSIWTFTPKFETIEQQPTVDISIAEKVNIDIVVKPYKLLFNLEDGLRGTADSVEIDRMIKELKGWSISNLTIENRNFGTDKLDALIRQENSITLFFQGEVPLPVYNNILNISELNIPEVTFDRIIIERNSVGSTMDMHFVSRESNLSYSAKAHVSDFQNFQSTIIERGETYAEYAEVNPEGTPFIAVPVGKVELISNTYYEEEISPSRFRDALFSDPNAVRRSQVDANLEEFQDDHALMSINTLTKNLDYVHPKAKSNELAIPSELLLKTFDFINEHGGWTDEYRFARMNPLSRYVEYQLYVHGLPVFSDTTSTKIEQVWGEDRIFRYMRPYYTLDLTLPSEKELKVLPSGVDVAEMLMQSDELDSSAVEEIIPGYYMKHDTARTDRSLFVLEPAWFYNVKGNWIRFSPEQLGGELIGLE